ncbi:MAG TPA: Rieske (2Fe-2S) protein [Abditibacteriaceae bacterium]|jgi:cytochrome b6-f complex iron-sulfur subunit
MSEDHSSISSRRAFLRTASVAVVGAAGAASVAAAEAEPKGAETPVRVLGLKDNAALQKVGGSKVIENGAEKIIVARTDSDSYVACSAICTHKGCEVEYHHDDKLFICPCHGARFDLQGNVVRGPAKTPLARYDIEAAAVLGLTPAEAKPK